MQSPWKITFEVEVIVEHKHEYWKAVIPGFPVFMYGATAQEAEARAVRGLSVLLESYMDTPGQLEQYLRDRAVEYQAFTAVGISDMLAKRTAGDVVPDIPPLGEPWVNGWRTSADWFKPSLQTSPDVMVATIDAPSLLHEPRPVRMEIGRGIRA